MSESGSNRHVGTCALCGCSVAPYQGRWRKTSGHFYGERKFELVHFDCRLAHEDPVLAEARRVLQVAERELVAAKLELAEVEPGSVHALHRYEAAAKSLAAAQAQLLRVVTPEIAALVWGAR